jgi:trk system potassium uptake protein TrkA
LGSGHPPVAVIGLGRFGRSLATELVRRGVEVLAIDRDQDVVQSLVGDLPLVVTADSTDLEALRQLHVARCRHVFVTIGNNFEASILTVLYLSDLAIPVITAKAQDALSAEVLRRVGAHQIISPESERGGQVATTVARELTRT